MPRFGNEIRNTKSEIRNKFKIRMFKIQNMKAYFGVDVCSCFEHLDFGHSNLFRISIFEFLIFNLDPMEFQKYGMGFGNGK